MLSHIAIRLKGRSHCARALRSLLAYDCRLYARCCFNWTRVNQQRRFTTIVAMSAWHVRNAETKKWAKFSPWARMEKCPL